MSSDKNNKFQFVDLEDILESDVKDSIDIVSYPEKVNVIENETDKNVKVTKKLYFGFEARVALSVFLILLLFSGACFLGIKVINHTSTEKILYSEYGSLKYQVCLKDATCLDEGSLYNADDVNLVQIFFNYDTKSEKRIKYDRFYRISANLISTDIDNNVIYYQAENDLVDKTKLNNENDFLINRSVTVNYDKYNNIVNEYVSGESISELEVSLYLDEENESRKISSAMIPIISDGAFEITKNDPLNLPREKEIKVNVWDAYSILFALFSSILVIISLILIYRTTKFVLRVTKNKNIYQYEVDSILKEYDNLIVIARDGYESLEEKEIIKLENFDELLDIRNNLSKPIIFSKINDIKCEFIVEDKNKLYKYIMKEADF